MRLQDALGGLDQAAFAALCRRKGVELDPRKKISEVEQAARALAMPREIVSPQLLSDEVRQTMRVLAAAPRGVMRESLGGALLVLVDAALVFPMPGLRGRFAMPTAYRVQLGASPSDDPRAARLLLPHLDDETLHAVAHAIFGRMPTSPRPIVLGELLAQLEDPRHVAQVIETLAPKERALLAAVEARGGEVDAAELLVLANDPARYTVAPGAPLPRRSAAFSLLRHGFVLPAGLDRWAVPAEVGAVIDRDRREEARRAREELLSRVASTDHAPPRARFGEDPGPPAVALLCALRSQAVALPADGGAPRTTLRRFARELTIEPTDAELLVALARAEGLATSSAALRDAGERLFRAWRRGGAWDEARKEEDRLRAPERAAQQTTPTAALRGALLDVLDALPEGRFARTDDVLAATLGDLRASGAAHVLSRAQTRSPDSFEGSVEDVVRKMLDVTLPALGAVDAGDGGEGRVVRLSARARRWLEAGEKLTMPPPQGDRPGRWTAAGRMRIGDAAPISQLVALADSTSVWSADGALHLEVTREGVERALARGLSTDTLRARLEQLVGELDGAAERALESAEASLVACAYVPASAFVQLSDELRARILEDPQGRELVIDPSPPGGLLVREGVPPARLGRVLRKHGASLDAIRPKTAENLPQKGS